MPKPIHEEFPDKASLERFIKETVQDSPKSTIKGLNPEIDAIKRRLKKGGL